MVETSPFALGPLIQQRRHALGLSQAALAARASGDGDDVRQSDISRLELGKVTLPRWPRLVRLAAALECSVAELLALGLALAAPTAPLGATGRPAALAAPPPPRRAIWRPTPRPPATVAWPDHDAIFALIAAAGRAVARSQALLAATAPLVADAAD